jgi:hypothetical protein
MTQPPTDDFDRSLTAALRRPRVGDEPPLGWADAVLARVPAPHTLRLRPAEVLAWALAWLSLLALAALVLLMTHADFDAWRSVLTGWDGAWPWLGLGLGGLLLGRPRHRAPFTP